VALFTAPIRSFSVRVDNIGECGTTVIFWASVLDGDHIQHLNTFDYILVSLSLANEGLSTSTVPTVVSRIADHDIETLRRIIVKLREMAPNARIVLGGPYPNQDYQPVHLKQLQRV
jgi:hypothetical protein